MASSNGLSSFRHEGHMFFIYDHTKKTEEDDPNDAILYFYPRSVGTDDRVALVGGIIGLADFCIEFLPESVPSVIKLSGHNFALLQHEDFIIALAGSPDVPDRFLIAHMQFVWSTFIFYQGSLTAMRERVSTDCFVKELNRVWDMYLPLCQLQGDSLSQSFQVLPYVQLNRSQSSLFLNASHILQRTLRHNGVIAGTLFNKNKVLCSHLSNSLTRQLLLLMPQSQFPCVEANSLLELPGGVRLLYVYLPQEDYAALDHRRSKTYTHQKPSPKEEEEIALSKEAYTQSRMSSRFQNNLILSDVSQGASSPARGEISGSRAGGTPGDDVSSCGQTSSGRTTKTSMVSPTATLTSGTDSEVYMDTLSEVTFDKHELKLSDITRVECVISSHRESQQLAQDHQDTSSSEPVMSRAHNHIMNEEVLGQKKEEKPPPKDDKILSKIDISETDSATIMDDDSKTVACKKDNTLSEISASSYTDLENKISSQAEDVHSLKKDDNYSEVPEKTVVHSTNTDIVTDEGNSIVQSKSTLNKSTSSIERDNTLAIEQKQTEQPETSSLQGNGTVVNNVDEANNSYSNELNVELNTAQSSNTAFGKEENASVESALLACHTSENSASSQQQQSERAFSQQSHSNTKEENAYSSSSPTTTNQHISELTENTTDSLSVMENSCSNTSHVSAASNSVGGSEVEEMIATSSSSSSSPSSKEKETALNVRRTLARSKQEIDESLNSRLTDESSTHSSSELKTDDREGSLISLTNNEVSATKDRLTFDSFDSENSEGDVFSPISEPGRLSPVAESGDHQADESSQLRSGSETGNMKTKFYQSGHRTKGGGSAQSSSKSTSEATGSKPKASSTPSSLPWDPQKNGLQELILYAQGHSDTLLVLLISAEVNCNRGYINSLWKACLSHLAELDFQVKDVERHAKDETENINASYQYIRYDSFTQSLKGSALLPVTSLANEIVDSSVKMHESFAEMPDLQDITYRSHSACCFGHRALNTETYFQHGLSRSAAGTSSVNDKTFSLDQIAEKALQNDAKISIL